MSARAACRALHSSDGADAASGTLPREVVLVDDLPGGDVAVGDEGAAGVLAGGLLGGQRFDAHFPRSWTASAL